MSKARCGTVTRLSSFAAGDGSEVIHIDGKPYQTTLNRERFPVRVGSIVEFIPAGNRAEIVCVQADLLEVRTAGLELFGGEQ